MNTGDKNTKGRAILKGPKGGLYVLGPSGTKLRTFTKATAAAAAVAAGFDAPPRGAALNTVTYRGAKFARMGNASVYGKPVYRKVGLSTYYTIGLSGIPIHIKASGVINKTNGTSVSLKNYKTSKTATATAAPAPRVATPPAMAAALGAALAKMNTIKTISGRAAYLKSASGLRNSIASLAAANVAVLTKRAANMNAANRAARAAKKAGSTSAPAAPTAAPHVAATERNAAAFSAAIAHITKLKTTASRKRYVATMRGVLPTANFNALKRRVANLDVAPPRVPTTSARITTAERNVRLAAIRARLNAMRVAKLAAMPKRRANVDKRLKNVVARVRARLRPTNRPTSGTLTVPFCHAPATVPRKACTMRSARIPVYTSPLIDDGTMLATRASDIDLDWFKRQDKYVKELSDYDFWTAQAHTNRSHSWIGPYLYKGDVPTYLPYGGMTHMAPLWPQIRKMILDGSYVDPTNSWIAKFKSASVESERYSIYKNHMQTSIPRAVMIPALRMYRDDLKRIIAGAPKSRKKMVLYRGSSFDIFRSTRGHWHTLNSFCSASYDLDYSLGYGGGAMLQRITVLPGTPVLLVAGMNQWATNGEYEIMVNLGTKYLIRGRGVKRVVWKGTHGGRQTTRVTDVTIAKA